MLTPLAGWLFSSTTFPCTVAVTGAGAGILPPGFWPPGALSSFWQLNVKTEMSSKNRGDKSLFIKDYLKLYTGKKVKGLGSRENKAFRFFSEGGSLVSIP
jgi:hypothetical protein